MAKKIPFSRQSSYARSLEDDNDHTNSDWKSLIPYEVQPGLCVIINNMDFMYAHKLPAAKRDEEHLKVLFTFLGFEVEVHLNLTGMEMKDKIKSYSEMSHTGVFVLIILSHGTLVNNKDAVIGTDGVSVEIHQLERLFYAINCPSLCEIPKIFIIDACRGFRHEITYAPTDKSITAMDLGESTSHTHLDIAAHGTNSSHFAILYASTHGNVAYTTNSGRYLTQTFVAVVAEASPGKTLIEITQEVKTRIQADNAGQTTELVDRLNRAYYIKRNTPMVIIQDLTKKFVRAVRDWISDRESTIQEIQRIIETLKEYPRNANATSFIGTFLSILGILSPLAVVGEATAAGATIVDKMIQKAKVKDAQEQLARDHEKLHAIGEIVEKIKSQIDRIRQQCPHADNSYIDEVLAQILDLIDSSDCTTSSIELATCMKIIPIDLIEIVRSSVNPASESDSHSSIIEQLTDKVKQLQEQKETIKFLAQIHDEQHYWKFISETYKQTLNPEIYEN